MQDLSPREKFIAGGAALMALLAFFPWIRVSYGGAEMGELVGGPNVNGFWFTEGVIAFIAALATFGLVCADRAGMLPWPARTRLLAPLAASGVGTLCMVICFGRFGGAANQMISLGRSMWFYLALVAMGFATFHAFQRWKEGTQAGAASPPSPPPL